MVRGKLRPETSRARRHVVLHGGNGASRSEQRALHVGRVDARDAQPYRANARTRQQADSFW